LLLLSRLYLLYVVIICNLISGCSRGLPNLYQPLLVLFPALRGLLLRILAAALAGAEECPSNRPDGGIRLGLLLGPVGLKPGVLEELCGGGSPVGFDYKHLGEEVLGFLAHVVGRSELTLRNLLVKLLV
jgi:hypothetical protein